MPKMLSERRVQLAEMFINNCIHLYNSFCGETRKDEFYREAYYNYISRLYKSLK